jgi:hypothetical protein
MKSRRAHQITIICPLPAGFYSSARLDGKLPDISGCYEIYHRFIPFLNEEQLRDQHMSASARSPSHCFSHRFPECFLLVFPSAAVSEAMFPHLGRHHASTAAPPGFIVVLVSEACQLIAYCHVFGLQSVEPDCQKLYTFHWDGSFASSLAFQPVAWMFIEFIGLLVSLCHGLCY